MWHLFGTAQCPTAVHVVLGVDNEHHLVCAEPESAVHITRALHTHEPLPGGLGLTTHGTHLLTLPAPELLQVPAGTGPRGGDLQAPEDREMMTEAHPEPSMRDTPSSYPQFLEASPIRASDNPLCSLGWGRGAVLRLPLHSLHSPPPCHIPLHTRHW